MTTTQTEHYRDLSAGYLRKARLHLADGDLPQASEKGWGAAAVLVKAAAEKRGWQHDGHRNLWNVIRQLVRETGDPDLRLQFGYAQTMHINFYEVAMNQEEVEEYLEHVERLVRKLEGLAT